MLINLFRTKLFKSWSCSLYSFYWVIFTSFLTYANIHLGKSSELSNLPHPSPTPPPPTSQSSKSASASKSSSHTNINKTITKQTKPSSVIARSSSNRPHKAANHPVVLGRSSSHTNTNTAAGTAGSSNNCLASVHQFKLTTAATTTSSTTQTRITGKRFYSPEKLPAFCTKPQHQQQQQQPQQQSQSPNVNIIVSAAKPPIQQQRSNSIASQNRANKPTAVESKTTQTQGKN